MFWFCLHLIEGFDYVFGRRRVLTLGCVLFFWGLGAFSGGDTLWLCGFLGERESERGFVRSHVQPDRPQQRESDPSFKSQRQMAAASASQPLSQPVSEEEFRRRTISALESIESEMHVMAKAVVCFERRQAS